VADANDLFRQIEQIEVELAKPGSNKTALKAAHRKLYAQYRKAVLA
jgi:hypothetical protein